MPEDRLRTVRREDIYSYHRYQYTEAMSEALIHADIEDIDFHRAVFALFSANTREANYWSRQILYSMSGSFHHQQDFWLAQAMNSGNAEVREQVYRRFVSDLKQGRILSEAVRAWVEETRGALESNYEARVAASVSSPHPVPHIAPAATRNLVRRCILGFSSFVSRRPAAATQN
jgi:hypothetical protein